jgi:RNA polymerase sigma factor (sigma-70 family)
VICYARPVPQTPTALADAREQFLALVEGVRPELHRYCARLTGSTVEGEDIVQETLAKAFYALSLSPDVPPLRPWLFRIAHNAAMDFLKSHARKYTDPVADVGDVVGYEERPDPAAVRAALAQFLTLPVTQRSALILKDVLGHSLEETAETMGTTVLAVKAALVRGRGRLGPGAAPVTSIAMSAVSTPATGTACARWSATTAGSTWWPGRNGAASRWAPTSRATSRRMWRCAWCASTGSWRWRRTWPAPRSRPTSCC